MATKVQLAQTQLVASQRLSMAEHRAEKALDALGQQRKKYKEERSQREQADQKLRHAESHRVAALRAQDEELLASEIASSLSEHSEKLQKRSSNSWKSVTWLNIERKLHSLEREKRKGEREIREAACEVARMLEVKRVADCAASRDTCQINSS
mmetsp:Transcript_22154/g.53187  ORF Transcript_22154/g.53187 Transcript_22154/m.53187 type:complete len:153 (+) Transcript_22154:102-560(+)